MVNLNECKFGDKLRTRDGRMALFLGDKPQLAYNICAIKDEALGFLSMFYNDNGTPSHSSYGNQYDIIAKCEDEK